MRLHALPPAALDNPQRRRTLITLAAWAAVGSGLSGCGGGGGQGSPDTADTQANADGRLRAAAVSTPMLAFLAGNVTGASLTLPTAIAVAADGSAYIVDKARHVLIAISPEGVIQILAGNDGFPSDYDGVGIGAAFSYPQGVAVDAQGTVYVADTNNHTIRRVDANGAVTTVYGNGFGGFGDGVGRESSFRYPCGLTVDNNGTLYVADSQNHCIRRITPDGQVSTIGGQPGSPGSENGSGRTARFNLPYAVAADDQGNVYVADSGNHTVRMIDIEGQVSTLAGLAGSFGTSDGKGTEARFDSPRGIQVDAEGTLYVTDRDNQTVRQITPDGVVTTWAGVAGEEGLKDGPGLEATFTLPCGLGRDSKGQLWLTELGNRAVRQIDTDGQVSTLLSEATGPDGRGAAAHFVGPQQVALDNAGVAYVADSNHHTIRKVLPDGTTTTLAGSGNYSSQDGSGSLAGFSYPQGVAVADNGTVYVADTYSHTIRKITPEGVVSTLAGSFYASGSADGTGATARFSYPTNLAVDSAGNVYVADTSNSTIRKITPAGVVSTLAGKAGELSHADGPGATARFYAPGGIAVDGQGHVYVGDGGNQVIRKISPDGVVSTLAGKPRVGGEVNGSATEARFWYPWRVAVDSAGQVFVADSRLIRKIGTDGQVSTLAGSNTSGFHAGVLPGAFNGCSGLAIRNGRLVFSTLNGLAQISPLS